MLGYSSLHLYADWCHQPGTSWAFRQPRRHRWLTSWPSRRVYQEEVWMARQDKKREKSSKILTTVAKSWCFTCPDPRVLLISHSKKVLVHPSFVLVGNGFFCSWKWRRYNQCIKIKDIKIRKKCSYRKSHPKCMQGSRWQILDGYNRDALYLSHMSTQKWYLCFFYLWKVVCWWNWQSRNHFIPNSFLLFREGFTKTHGGEI